MQERRKQELAEFLWLEINRAILNSSSVRNCLKVLKKMDMLDFLCEHDYILDGKKLVDKLLQDPCGSGMSDSILNPENSIGMDFATDLILNDGETLRRLNPDLDYTEGSFAQKLIKTYGFTLN